ncbi:MAG: F0F1 ATP synthase subunit delta [Chloroflexota bacterium]|nr:MAG: F0F1 ATP synthase subunit delta [Chloroflexota bacterium]
MQRNAIAKRYAQAVFDIARENKQFDRWMADLREMAAVVDEEELAALLENPKVRLENKSRLLRSRLAGIAPLALNLALLLATKDRFFLASQIRDEYEKLLNDHLDVAVAEATTAVELSEAEQAKLATRLGQLMGKRVVLRTKVDPAIGGGLLARIGDKVIDGTIHTRLAMLRDKLVDRSL